MSDGATAEREHSKKRNPYAWQPGVSGNPKGRLAGSRHRATLAAEALLDGEAEGLTRKAVEMALAGDGLAMRLCMERLLPVRRNRTISLDLPPGPADAMRALVVAMAAGELAPDEASKVAAVLQAVQQATVVEELQQRIESLEQKLQADGA